MKFESNALERGIQTGSLAVVLDHHLEREPSESSKASLLELFRELTCKSGAMFVFGLEDAALEKWGETVSRELIPAGSGCRQVLDFDKLASSQRDFLLREAAIRGRIPGPFGWAIPHADSAWLGMELGRRAGVAASTEAFHAMLPPMKRWAQKTLRLHSTSLIVEYGRFADAIRIFTRPPLPSDLVPAMLIAAERSR